jgi:nitrogen fixation protein FixH
MASTSYVATATTNAVLVAGKPTCLTGWSMVNTSAATKFVRLYNKATAPIPASDAALIVMRRPLPAGQSSDVQIGANAMWLSAGLAFDITGGAADTDSTAVTAGDVTLTLFYA